MEIKLKAWIARDEDGELWLHFSHPLKDKTTWLPINTGVECAVGIQLDSNVFPSVKWEDEEPTEVYITLAEQQEQTKQEQPKQEQTIDWEQRRYEIAKDILSAQHGNYPLTVEEGTDFAVEVADMLIAKLKEQSE